MNVKKKIILRKLFFLIVMDVKMVLFGDLLESIDVVVDTIFNPLNTRLLSEAIFSDCQTVSGLDMYLYQAMASVDIWFGPQDWSRIKMNEMREAVHNKITGFKRKFE